MHSTYPVSLHMREDRQKVGQSLLSYTSKAKAQKRKSSESNNLTQTDYRSIPMPRMNISLYRMQEVNQSRKNQRESCQTDRNPQRSNSR
ncbi:hypothetical protein C2845_PM07G27170 [Panicum miliaceum]|uniref:Uncharacterized protein n=1 Tax=Panicum miliaceum TaxID=4540 RepID=A0A3L6SL84_PANMI|nr:hypothetical protein C2845_PM07G27170 [Panicum miliaceum]